MELAFILGAILALAYREAWFDSRMRSVDSDKLYVLSVSFAVALILSLLWLLISLAFSEVSLGEAGKPVVWSFVWLALFTTISWTAAFLAILTALRSSRAGFLDWGMVPVFAVLATVVFESAPVLQSVPQGVGVIFLVGGCGLVIASLTIDEKPNARWWPTTTSYRKSLVVGTVLALIASLSGVLTFQYGRELRLAGVDTAVLMPIRIIPLAPMLFVASYVRGNRNWRISTDLASVCLKFAIICLAPLYVLFELMVLDEFNVRRVAMCLILLPIFVFILNLWPFRLRLWSKIPWPERAGMFCVVVGWVLTEIVQVSEP